MRIAKALVFIFIAACAMGQSVVLTWVQSTTPNVTGNNAYRAPASTGPWVAIYDSQAPIVTYTDTTVVLGQRYCYGVTAMTVEGESPKSNIACKTVTTAAPKKLVVK